MQIRLNILVAAVSSALLLATACGPSNDPVDAAVPQDASHVDVLVQWDVPMLPDTTVPDAYVPGCGNGALDPDEACDDGNEVSGDGCNATCTMADGFDVVAAAWTDGNQLNPQAAVAGSALILVWEDWGLTDLDGAGARVRPFQSDGNPLELPVIGNTLDFAANIVNTGDQHEVAVAGHHDGRFVVVWTDTSDTLLGGIDVRAQMFGADGTRLSNPVTGAADFVVHTTATGTQRYPAVAIADSGLILITWSDDSATGGDPTGWSVRGRLFDFNGVPQTNLETGTTDDFVINTLTTGNQYRPTIAANGNLGWAVAWTDDGNLDTDGGIMAALLGAYGDHLTATDVQINTTTTGLQDEAAIVLQPGSGFVVVWTDDSRSGEDTYFKAIRARPLDQTLTARTNGVNMTTDDFLVNTLTEGSQQAPALAADPVTGDVIMVWQDGSASDGSWAGIRGRAFSVALVPLTHQLSVDGGDFRINTTVVEAQLRPAVSVIDGYPVVVWEDNSGGLPDVSGTAIRYRFLSPLW